MDRYAYLLLGVSLLILLAVALLRRRDLVPKALKLGSAGGFAGLASELFYTRDYWRAPSIFGIGKVSPEDFIFGFAITSLSFVIYPFIFRHTFTSQAREVRLRMYGLFFIFGLLGMLVLNVYEGLNSIFVSSAIFITSAVIILTLRRDLLRVGVCSVLVLVAVITVVYVVLFDVIAPSFWETYWLLAHARWGVMILGHVPVTELLWYSSWTFFASISYPFVTGKKLTKLKRDPTY